jgi:hypothetical protein
MSDDSRGRRDHDEEVEKARDKRRRRMPHGPPRAARNAPSGAEPCEGKELWLDGKDAQPPVEKRSSW